MYCIHIYVQININIIFSSLLKNELFSFYVFYLIYTIYIKFCILYLFGYMYPMRVCPKNNHNGLLRENILNSSQLIKHRLVTHNFISLIGGMRMVMGMAIEQSLAGNHTAI